MYWMDTAQWISQISGIPLKVQKTKPFFCFTHWDQRGVFLPLYHASLLLHPFIFLIKIWSSLSIEGLADPGFNVSQWSAIATKFVKNIQKGYLVRWLRSIIQAQQYTCTLHWKWKGCKLFSFQLPACHLRAFLGTDSPESHRDHRCLRLLELLLTPKLFSLLKYVCYSSYSQLLYNFYHPYCHFSCLTGIFQLSGDRAW